MDLFSCDECRDIYRELRDASRRAGESATPQDLAAWVLQLDEEECARLRESSDLWKVWRRMREHRAVTGHWQPVMALPPGAMSAN